MPAGRHSLARVVAPFWFLLAATAIVAVPSEASAQPPASRRGGGGSSTSRVVSPAVFASWMSNANYGNGRTTTLLVLWRGSPGWLMKRPANGGGRSSSAGSSGSTGYQTVTQGGLTFTLNFDFDKEVVKMVNREVSLREVNVVLVDLVDSPGGPTIVGTQWLDPNAASTLADGDPIAATIKGSSELFAYLRCDVGLPDAVLAEVPSPQMRQAMSAMTQVVCDQMRPRP